MAQPHQYVSGAYTAEVLNAPTLQSLDAGNLNLQSLFGIAGRWCVVTGARVGLGFIMAATLVSNGANVIMTARDRESLSAAAASLNAKGPGKAYAVAADLNPLDGVLELVAAVGAITSKVDILINNAGIDLDKSTLDEFPDSAFEEILHLNLTRCFTVTQKFLPLLTTGSSPTNPSRVIMVASMDGQRTPTEYENYAYVAAKSGLIQLTRNLSARLARRGVLVNAIGPGVFLSQMTADFVIPSASSAAESQPLKRFGKPEDIAAAILFLCGPGGSFVTGHCLNVDGGYLASQGMVVLEEGKGNVYES
ncbi:short-chain dehydrogenase/reductase SDR [Gonapodya prolifera JEL478]|uniref:Short-chain dehydrogenase/reductase SDR n=1 Tax=Gonapodya prolifera (strain JEL478) TaxID=1344416 RepID=A0A138ZZU6_GONPJ|nr:short-chain dehydrogenase/reductase SDR [Gonapodya prolifera JEL478]|eukprot:KXS09992.1 short-chain dehydrogenase/reductase SDR [Gonapodya prolifera JEL478]